ncbi:hypothetical protein K438DRAFT_1988736 [Mycena galopus ATCC 62051]|nr:hypothetical protein K438DRAFT_1988736 [Mycena galopus ATCC 62051]
MSLLEMVWSLSVTSYSLWFTTIGIPLHPYSSWAFVHSNFSRIGTYPTIFTPDIVLRACYFLWWLVPIPTFAFVAMFAFGHDAVEEYKKCFQSIRRVIFRQSASGSSSDKKGAMELLSYESSASPRSTKPAYSYKPPSPSRFSEAFAETDYDSSLRDTDVESMSPSTTHTDYPHIPTFNPTADMPTLQCPFTYPSFDASHRGIDAT